ncbi:hypothetical protein ACX80O_15720 [Arthrobacter sp. Hz1]
MTDGAGDQLIVRRAAIADLFPLSWNISLALARGRSPKAMRGKRVRAVLMMPVMVLLFLVYLPAGDVITTPGRDAVIFLTEARNPVKTLRRATAIAAVFLGIIGGLFLWLIVLTGLDDAVQPWVGLLIPLWLIIGLVLVASSTGGSLSAAVEAMLSRPAGPYWVAQALASASGTDRDGLVFAKAAIERFVPSGTPILVTAASEKITVIYERFGFTRQKPGSLNLIATRVQGRNP